jgi:hypothetical protein
MSDPTATLDPSADTATDPAGDLVAYVRAALERDGYDGLFNDKECACKTDDLMPCEGPATYCRPGYLRPLTDAEWDDGLDFWIGPTKPPTPAELEAAGQLRLGVDPAEDHAARGGAA